MQRENGQETSSPPLPFIKCLPSEHCSGTLKKCAMEMDRLLLLSASLEIWEMAILYSCSHSARVFLDFAAQNDRDVITWSLCSCSICSSKLISCGLYFPVFHQGVAFWPKQAFESEHLVCKISISSMGRGSLLFSQPCILKTNPWIATGLYCLLVNTVVYRAAEAREKYCEFSLS